MINKTVLGIINLIQFNNKVSITYGKYIVEYDGFFYTLYYKSWFYCDYCGNDYLKEVEYQTINVGDFQCKLREVLK